VTARDGPLYGPACRSLLIRLRNRTVANAVRESDCAVIVECCGQVSMARGESVFDLHWFAGNVSLGDSKDAADDRADSRRVHETDVPQDHALVVREQLLRPPNDAKWFDCHGADSPSFSACAPPGANLCRRLGRNLRLFRSAQPNTRTG
jgi:hypothetical protein